MSPREVAIVGVAMTRFTKQAERGHAGLASEAVREALRHSGLGPKDIQAAFSATVAGGPGTGQRILKDLAITGVPIVNVDNACASSSTGLREAYAWIKAGLVDCALVVGVEILSVVQGALPMPDGWVARSGMNLPGWYAMKARRHMSEYGLTREQLASVVVKSRQFAALNPYAHFREPTTAAEVLGSAMVADPLTLYQCCPKVDGAAAAVVCSADFVRSRGLRPTWIRASAMVSGMHVYTDAPDFDPAPNRAADLAWEQASLGPKDVQVIECHDAFSIGEIIYTEALGLCPVGEGGKLCDSGATGLGGSGPAVNPSGGLLSRGHPLGASGIAQVAEVVWHLRGEAGDRQVPGARLGIVHTMGAAEFDLDANACCVHVLEAG